MSPIEPVKLEQLKPDFQQRIAAAISHQANDSALEWSQLFPYAKAELETFVQLENNFLSFCSGHWETGVSFISRALCQQRKSKSRQLLLDGCPSPHILQNVSADIFLAEQTVSSLTPEQKEKVSQAIGEPLPENDKARIKSLESQSEVVALRAYTQAELFGTITLDKDKNVFIKPGALLDGCGGFLVLNVSPLLEQPELWYGLKRVLLTGKLNWFDALSNEKHTSFYFPEPCQVDTRIILMGDRAQLAELNMLDPDYRNMNQQFTEISNEIKAEPQNLILFNLYLQELLANHQLPGLTAAGFNQLCIELSSRREHREYLLFEQAFIVSLLKRAALNSKNVEIGSDDLIQVITQEKLASCLPQQYSDESIRENQVPISLSGKAIGQVNGLSVVELEGHPSEFGEVFRVTAAEFLGDGEVIDVERKADMAGNIHSKAMMIVQGYLNQLFAQEAHFPFSANIVFEQSYSQTDGDSASVATLVALFSSLSYTPALQNMAMTGAMDQSGQVLAVGGINQKIEAFYRTAQIKQETGTLAVVMPKANLINLNLSPAVLTSIDQGTFKIYAIEHIDQAIELVLGLKAQSDKDEDSIVKRIDKRVQDVQDSGGAKSSASLLGRVIGLFLPKR